MRAAAEDVPAARLMGINVNRVVAVAFAIGSALAAVAGLLYSVQAGQINPYMGFTPVLKAFIAAVIGGFGSISGAVLGGFVLGILEVLVTALSGIGDLLPAGSVAPELKSFLQQWLPSGLASWRDAIVFVVLILVLLVRPQGILGRRDRGDDA
jgi:branched-chain amino acid transport system permease protein